MNSYLGRYLVTFAGTRFHRLLVHNILVWKHIAITYRNTTAGTTSETLTTYISVLAISSSPLYPGKYSVHEKSRGGFTAEKR